MDAVKAMDYHFTGTNGLVLAQVWECLCILLSLMAKHKYVTVFESYFFSDVITVMNMIHDDMVMGSIPAQIMMHHHPYC